VKYFLPDGHVSGRTSPYKNQRDQARDASDARTRLEVRIRCLLSNSILTGISFPTCLVDTEGYISVQHRKNLAASGPSRKWTGDRMALVQEERLGGTFLQPYSEHMRFEFEFFGSTRHPMQRKLGTVTYAA
jgi:hypothetical protein